MTESNQICPRCRVEKVTTRFYRVKWMDAILVCNVCAFMAYDQYYGRMRKYTMDHDGTTPPIDVSSDFRPEWLWLQHMELMEPAPASRDPEMRCWKCGTQIIHRNITTPFLHVTTCSECMDDRRVLCVRCSTEQMNWNKAQHGLAPIAALQRRTELVVHGCMCPADVFDPRRRR